MSMKKYDFIVIGGGGAGLSSAFTAAGLGKKTLLVEKDKTGGECTWNGCIPSKALIHLAELAKSAEEAGARDFKIENPFEKVDAVRRKVYSHETPEVLAERGVETLIGTAVFTGPDSIEVNGEGYTAKRFMIAIGSRAMVPPVPGLSDIPYLTNESLFELKSLPKSMLIMGGGPIGLEMAQSFKRLGTDVTVVEMLDRVLFREDQETAKVIEEQLESEGIKLLTGTRAVGAEKRSEGIALKVESGGKTEILEAESLLVSVGRSPTTDGLGLDKANVKVHPKGVVVNNKMQTSNRRIYAAGDVAGPYAFSHMAEYQGVKGTLNAILPLSTKASYKHVSWCTFTDPELAAAGYTEEEARKIYGDKIKIYRKRFEDLDRGMTAEGTKGLAKIILAPNGKIVGAHIAGPRAGELISEIQVLKTMGIPFYKLRVIIHPYPVFADILRHLAKPAALDRLMNHPVVRLIRKMQGK